MDMKLWVTPAMPHITRNCVLRVRDTPEILQGPLSLALVVQGVQEPLSIVMYVLQMALSKTLSKALMKLLWPLSVGLLFRVLQGALSVVL
jgi:hypothetical protein